MKRLTLGNALEMNMRQLALNQVYVGKDGWARYVEDPDRECGVCDLIRTASEALGVELPILSDEDLSDLMTDWLQYGAEEPEGVVAILYRALCAMAEVRDKLFRYEDTGLEPEEIDVLRDREQGLDELLVNISCGRAVTYARLTELAQAEKNGRLVVLPPNAPLTLEELREMDGEPVWTVTIGLEGSGRWELCTCEMITACPIHKVLRCVASNGEVTDYELGTYGKTWLAYRRRPEERTVERRGRPKCFYNDNGSEFCLGMAPEYMNEPTERCKKCGFCESGYHAEEGMA